MDTDGVNFRHQKQKEKPKVSYEEARKKRKLSSIPRKHRSIRQMKENLLERKIPFEVW